MYFYQEAIYVHLSISNSCTLSRSNLCTLIKKQSKKNKKNFHFQNFEIKKEMKIYLTLSLYTYTKVHGQP